MARTGVTYEDVAQAASTLQSNGKNPTIEQIRKLLGTGSSTTLAKHLRAWKENIANAKEELIRRDLPVELVGSIKSLWKALQEKSDETISIQEEKNSQVRVVLEEELSKYKQNNIKWQKIYHQLQLDKTSLEQQLANNMQTIKKQDTRLAVLNQSILEKDKYIEELQAVQRQAQINFEALQQSTREERLLAEDRFDKIKDEMNARIKAFNQQLTLISKLESEKSSLLQKIQIYENELAKYKAEMNKKDDVLSTKLQEITLLYNKIEAMFVNRELITE